MVADERASGLVAGDLAVRRRFQRRAERVERGDSVDWMSPAALFAAQRSKKIGIFRLLVAKNKNGTRKREKLHFQNFTRRSEV